MDVKLFLFLSERIQRLYRLTSVTAIKPKPGALPPMPPIAALGEAGKKWIAWLYEFCKSKGCVGLIPPHPGNLIVQPQHADTGSLMVALNKLFYNVAPSEFIAPKFPTASNGQLTTSDLMWHMSKPACQRSSWFDLKAASAGPQREVLFFDLSSTTTLPSGPGNWTVEFMLMQELLRLCGNYNFSLGLPPINSGQCYLADTFHLFREKVRNLGWPVESPNTTTVAPTGGLSNAASLIRALNYYSRNNPALAGGPWYAPLSSSNNAALQSALNTCTKKSRIFG